MPSWLVRDMIPAGAIVMVADLDDPAPDALLRRGADVVIRLHGRGAMDDAPVQVRVHWRPALVPGHHPPTPFWIRFDGREFVRVEKATHEDGAA